MNIVHGFLVVLGATLIASACTPSEDEGEGNDTLAVTDTGDTGDGAVTPDEGDDGTTTPDEASDETGDSPVQPDVDMAQCAPGDTAECYHGPSGTKDRGICKAGTSTCAETGYWGPCEGEVLPKPEICHNDIDENCDGEDGTEDNTFDYDQDGYTYCTGDCCEFPSECLHPELVNPAGYDFPGNEVDDNCDGTVDEVNTCDSGLAEDSSDPTDMAKAMDLCPKPVDKEYGLIDAKLSLADGTGTPLEVQHKIYPGFGNVIKPHTGAVFLMLSSGTAGNPYTSTQEDLQQHSSAPADWYQANGNQFPSSPSCAMGTPGTEPVNDPIMLAFTIKAPKNAHAFGVDIYFLSREFPEYVCDYNDFLVILLDSSFSSSDPNLQNPFDKNLAMDEKGNPVGINLAPAGLFRVCCNGPNAIACGYDPMHNYMQYCTLGPGELDGTGLYDASTKEGGTGWLVTRGNIVPGEEFTLRIAIWDTRDNILDSLVLLDNFRWFPIEVKPGTSIQE